MKLRSFVLSALLVGGFSGCATSNLSVDTIYTPENRTGDFSTYRWYFEPKNDTEFNRYNNNALIHERLQDAIESELQTRGYSKISQGTPDFEVGYLIAAKEEVSTIVADRYFGSRARGGAQDVTERAVRSVERKSYDAGTLIIDIVDANTRKVVYRSAIQTDIDRARGPEERSALIKEAVRKAMADFPDASSQ